MMADHVYTLDVADSALVWRAGEPLDVGSVLTYIQDRGHVVLAAEPQVDGDGPTGLVTIRTDAPASEIPPAEWAAYDGSRYRGIVQTAVTWTDTAEGAIVAKPDLPRLVGFWRWLERNGYQVVQVSGAWNFATPDTAPASPVLNVYARGSVDSAVTDAYLYSAVSADVLDGFTATWNAAMPQSVMQRRQAGQVATPGQDDGSTPILFSATGATTNNGVITPTPEPAGDVRDGDIVGIPTIPPTYLRRVADRWVQLASYTLTNESSTATGRRANASGLRSTATGVNAQASEESTVAAGEGAEASGDNAVAIGSRSGAKAPGSIAVGASATVASDAERSIAIGFSVQVTEADTTVIETNTFRQRRSSGTGATTYTLLSPDGTDGEIGVTDDDRLTVNGRDVAHHVRVSLRSGTRTSTCSLSSVSTPATIIADTALGAALPAGTWAGWIRFGVAAQKTAESGNTSLNIYPRANGGYLTAIPNDAVLNEAFWCEGELYVSGLAGGSTPTFGLAVRPGDGTATYVIRSAVISGDLWRTG